VAAVGDTQAIAGDVREVDRREEEEASEAAAEREEREAFEQRCVALQPQGQPAAACCALFHGSRDRLVCANEFMNNFYQPLETHMSLIAIQSICA